MELSEGIKLKGQPAEIPDCSRNDLPEYFKSLGFKVGAEVGVYLGEYSEVLAKSGMKIYSIDPWKPYNDYGYFNELPTMEKIYNRAAKRLAPYKNLTIIRQTSAEAVSIFDDNMLDFVYIDANHRFKYIAEDLWIWSRKVKRGGIIAGHDYALFKHRTPGTGCQVREIVDAWARAYDLNFWVLGNRKVKEGEARDRMRSWMFVKEWDNAE